jgi:hypothetical protein
MFSFKPASRRLMNIYMGITLGVGAMILYLTFLIAYTFSHSGELVLLPLESVYQSHACK